MKQNFLSGLDALLAAWDGSGACFKAHYATSQIGNVNLRGAVNCYEASILPRCDPRFVEAIEPGIRPLVLFLVDELQCITYSSCEGHRATLGSPLRERHAGIIPRTDEERRRLLIVFQTAAEATAGCASVEVAVVDGMLHSDTSTVPCIDILFRSTEYGGEMYFAYLNDVCDRFMVAVVRLQPSSEAGSHARR